MKNLIAPVLILILLFTSGCSERYQKLSTAVQYVQSPAFTCTGSDLDRSNINSFIDLLEDYQDENQPAAKSEEKAMFDMLKNKVLKQCSQKCRDLINNSFRVMPMDCDFLGVSYKCPDNRPLRQKYRLDFNSEEIENAHECLIQGE